MPELALAAVDMADAVGEVARRYSFADHLLFTSRGYNFSSALEAALKVTEATGIPAHAFSSADLLHGPMAMVEKGFPVIAIVPYGPAARP